MQPFHLVDRCRAGVCRPGEEHDNHHETAEQANEVSSNRKNCGEHCVWYRIWYRHGIEGMASV